MLRFCLSKYLLILELGRYLEKYQKKYRTKKKRYFKFQQFFCLQLQLVKTVGVFIHSASRVSKNELTLVYKIIGNSLSIKSFIVYLFIHDKIHNKSYLIVFKVGLSPSKEVDFICFNESSINMVKKAFNFMLKAVFLFETFKFLL